VRWSNQSSSHLPRFFIYNCIFWNSSFLAFVANSHSYPCLNLMFEGCWVLTNHQWSQPFSTHWRSNFEFATFSKIPEHVCGVWSGAEICLSSALLTSMPHPLGKGSKNHSWWICHRRAVYWWRRQPHHQKSNHHWDFMLLLEFKFSALKSLLFSCCSVTSWNIKTLLFTVASYRSLGK
jgi:hypothetical protein